MPPLVASEDPDPTSASTSASLLTSASTTAPPRLPSRPIERRLASAVATLRPRARTVSDAASTVTSGRSPSNDAFTAPRTVAVGERIDTLIDPPPAIVAVAFAEFAPVASTCTAPVEVTVETDDTSASTSALDPTSAVDTMPFALPKIPTDTTAEVALAVLPPVACTVTAPELAMSPSREARTAPWIVACGRFTPTATTPPAPPSDVAVAVLPPFALIETRPVEFTVASGLEVAVTSAPDWMVASAPDPDSDTTPMPTNCVSACAYVWPLAETATPPEPSTAPSSRAVTAAPIVATDWKSPALIAPPEPPCARAFA